MKKHTFFSSFLRWLDENCLLLFSGFLLAFIPLFPKIPLFSPIEQYIVRVRLEDFFMLFAVFVWCVQWFRKKVSLKHPIVTMMVGYFMVGFLSVLSALFLIKTVPLQPLHVGKTLLHFFRYIEYFSLFVIVFSAIKTKKHVQMLFGVLLATLIGVIIYGYGQRYYYWPVYSTMNREFSKGVRLYLTEHARVQSTFAGHYDLGGYLVLILPFALAFAISAKKKWQKVFFHAVHWGGLWLLVECASRTSFVAYLVGITIVIVMLSWKEKNWKKRIAAIISRELFIGFLMGLTIMVYGDAIYERFLQVIEGYPAVNQAYHAANDKRKKLVSDPISTLGLSSLFPKAQVPENAISTDEAASVIVSSDTRPTPVRPSDVYVDIPDLVKVATISAEGKATTIYVEKPRTFSANALKHGLSLAIRLDALWPQAVRGFQRNPLIGSGYATLNKEGYQQFTEADSTDNNFLRTLGETGILGVITFYGSILFALWIAARMVSSSDEFLSIVSIAYVAGSVGLLLNATYIDVYASSKDAFIFWGVTGLLMGYGMLSKEGKQAQKPVESLIERFESKVQKAVVVLPKKAASKRKK